MPACSLRTPLSPLSTLNWAIVSPVKRTNVPAVNREPRKNVKIASCPSTFPTTTVRLFLSMYNTIYF
jgi:hypothetical protein